MKKAQGKKLHRTVAAESARRKYWDRVNSGRCHKCGNKRGKRRAEFTTCHTCALKENARLTAFYHRNKEEA